MLIVFFLLGLMLLFGICLDLPTATALTSAGLTVSGALATAGAASQTMANTGKELLVVQNGSVGSINVTLTTFAVEEDNGGDLTIQDRVVAVPAGATKILGPFKPSIYNNDDDEITIALSAFADVTVQVVSATTYRARD